MNYRVLEYGVIDDVAVITMNNPPVNALGIQFLEDITTVLDQIESPGAARAVLITSSCPGFFSTGDDVGPLKDIDDEMINMLPAAHAFLDRLEALPLPTVAGINGHALGGGFELALACDFRFMGRDSGSIGMPEVRLGMIPVMGGTQRLPQIVGRAKALEMMIKGRALTPGEAKESGIVTDIFPQEELFERSLEYARRLARQATMAIGRIKRCVMTGLKDGFDAGMAMEFQTFRENIRTHDAREGIDAFLTGRRPEFRGRD
ncbi:MAG: enoyl-CoA hydratase/isomerase family protein [Deltaproteobacteria bacterium]|nr:enoyl-CoA hydratase/isomerase family protein [Deltaproteobacteria bacterium]